MYQLLKGRLIFVRLLLLAAAMTLIIIGIAVIYSLGHPAETGPASQNKDLTDKWEKQIQFACVGFVGFVLVNILHYRRLGAVSYGIYAVVLLVLAVLLLGKIVNLSFVPMINGTHRWLRFTIAGFTLPAVQPSEFCKIAYILALAWFLRYRSNCRKFSALISPFLLTILPMILILLEPNLGTVLLMMPVFLVMIFVAGAKARHIGIIILLGVVISPFMWAQMRSYQRIRISCVLLQSEWVRQMAEQHPAFARVLVGTDFSNKQLQEDWAYHLTRSKFAVASGGLAGYGYGKGPFIKYNFLPERHNDFIFAAIAHQWGFVGCLAVLSLYIIIFACGLKIAEYNSDPFGKLLAVGIVTMLAVEVLVNVSMTLGLMPITGLTLPLISYGGSSLVGNMMAIGLLNNVGRSWPFTVARKSF